MRGSSFRYCYSAEKCPCVRWDRKWDRGIHLNVLVRKVNMFGLFGSIIFGLFHQRSALSTWFAIAHWHINELYKIHKLMLIVWDYFTPDSVSIQNIDASELILVCECLTRPWQDMSALVSFDRNMIFPWP